MSTEGSYDGVPIVQTPPVDEGGRSVLQTAPERQAQAQVCLSFHAEVLCATRRLIHSPFRLALLCPCEERILG